MKEGGGRGWVFALCGLLLACALAGSLIAVLRPSRQPRIVVFSPDGSLLASAAHVGYVSISGTEEDGIKHLSRGRTKEIIRAIAISSQNELVAVAGFSSAIELWSLVAPTGVMTRQILDSRTNPTEALVFSFDGQYLASCGASGGETAFIWNSTTGDLLFAVPALKKYDQVECLALSRDCRLLVAGHLDGVVQVYAIPDGVEVARLTEHRRPVGAVCFSPDSSLLACGSRGLGNYPARTVTNEMATLTLWERKSWKMLGSLEPDTFSVKSIVFSPDGRFLVVTDGREIHVYDVTTRENIRVLRVDRQGVIGAIVFCGDRLMAGMDNGEIIKWRVAGKEFDLEAH